MKSTSSITTLLFDWDGTLADSAHLGLAAFQKTFVELGVAFPPEIYEAAYSPNWYSTYEALGLPREKWQAADDLWRRYYAIGVHGSYPSSFRLLSSEPDIYLETITELLNHFHEPNRQ